jgi:hypothetical protein
MSFECETGLKLTEGLVSSGRPVADHTLRIDPGFVDACAVDEALLTAIGSLFGRMRN